MLLAIDIGNSHITLGLWSGRDWVHQWRLRTVHDKTVDEYGVYLRTLLRENSTVEQVDDAILSSVVPPLTATFVEVCRQYLGLEALLVDANTPTGIVIATENPAEVGADRIVNAAAAHQHFEGASIVVDMGTATTFDVISAKGELLGVAIAPGLDLAAGALASRAAQLGRVALKAPPSAIGRNTVQAMQSGLVFGYVSLIEGLVERIAAELEEPQINVIGTGGLITVIAPLTEVITHVEPWLTLNGLLTIFQLNRLSDSS
ncbi:MAG: type III pantothenate kinase [Candidatus Promineifilaceae bacterium]|nr:type III pantothenate kinase [Candidatus Promineifilaceae bacterium]